MESKTHNRQPEKMEQDTPKSPTELISPDLNEDANESSAVLEWMKGKEEVEHVDHDENGAEEMESGVPTIPRSDPADVKGRQRKKLGDKTGKRREKSSDDEDDDGMGSQISSSDGSAVSSLPALNLRSITYMHLEQWCTRSFESVIEVLLDQELVDSLPPTSSLLRKNGTSHSTKNAKPAKKFGSLNPSWSKVKALQLMIHSDALIANLKEIDLKIQWEPSYRKGRIVFIRPFKFLVLREAEIRQRFKDLEKLRSSMPAPPPPPPPPLNLPTGLASLHNPTPKRSDPPYAELVSGSDGDEGRRLGEEESNGSQRSLHAALTHPIAASTSSKESNELSENPGDGPAQITELPHLDVNDSHSKADETKANEATGIDAKEITRETEALERAERSPQLALALALNKTHLEEEASSQNVAEEAVRTYVARQNAEEDKLERLERLIRAQNEEREAEREKAPIRFKDAVGRKFSFPFHLCKTWTGISSLINQAFLHVDVIGPHVQDGHYDLVGPDGTIILPQYWGTVIQPDWAITMHMWPMPEPPPPPPGIVVPSRIQDTDVALEDFRLLIRFMDEDLKDLFEMRGKIEDATLEVIAFDDLWHLFQYGEEVILTDEHGPGKPAAARVFKFTGGRNNNGPPEMSKFSDGNERIGVDALGPGSWGHAFVVQCWSLMFDGSLYWPQEVVVGIRPYEGEMAISSLPVYPSKFDKSGQKEKLIQRGRVFKQFTDKPFSHRKYLGRNLGHETRGEELDSEVIIDFREAVTTTEWLSNKTSLEDNQITHDICELHVEYPEHGLCDATKGWCIQHVIGPDFAIDALNHETFLRHNKQMIQAKETIDESEVALLPDRVPGYVLNRKYWAVLSTSTECLMQVQGTSDPWNDLVLEARQKDIVEALVAKHLHHPIDNNEVYMPYQLGDFVAGKGRSIVLLLHGPPGVGKTSTAECIAAHMSTPLYPLTSGNLPVRANDLESQLQMHFELAERWGCILLLDEADVFLQRRRLNELEINAMVSVFLRQLEYYRGILFLTTNRVGDIDPAFKSRIHVSLEYEPLDRRRTKKIYKLHLRRIKEALEMRTNAQGSNFKIKEEEILVWSDQHFKKASKKRRQWNGRQIHNAFQTAVALAEWEARTNPSKKHESNVLPELILGKKQFKQVAQVSEGFDQYMTDLMGGRNEAEIAAISAQRYDYRPANGGDSRKGVASDSDSDSDGDTQSNDEGSDSDVAVNVKNKGKKKNKKKKKGLPEDSSDDGGKRKSKGKNKKDSSDESASSGAGKTRSGKSHDKKKSKPMRRSSSSESD